MSSATGAAPRGMSVRVRLAAITALITCTAYVGVAWALMGVLTDRISDDVSAQLVHPTAPADATAYPTEMTDMDVSPAKPDPAASDTPDAQAVDVLAVQLRPALSAWARTLIFATAPLLGVLTGALTYWVTRRALRPVTAIETEFRRLAAGDTGARVVEPAGRDEISRLAQTFNHALNALSISQARQHRFVADAAHELRSPIGAMRTTLEVAATYPERIDASAAINSALAQVAHLSAIAEDLLTLARLETARISIETRLVSVAELVADLRAPATGIGYSVVGADLSIVVEGSTGELRRMLQNLVDNAARYGRHRIEVTIRRHDRSVVIDVDDDGVGIPPQFREQVFVAFFQVEESRTRADEGSGLGLAIAAETAHRHGGTLHAYTSPLGGARLRVSLPTTTSRPIAPDPQPPS